MLFLHNSLDKLVDCGSFENAVFAIRFVSVKVLEMLYIFAELSAICGTLITVKFLDAFCFSDSSSIK